MATKKQQAQQTLRDWNATTPSEYNDTYSTQANTVLNELAGRDFTKNYTSGTDQNYQNYAKNYTAAAQAAAAKTRANAALLSGGYGSSYADSAAAQSYQEQMTGLDNILPQLRQMALNGYQEDENNLETLLSGLQNEQSQALNEYETSVSDWQNWRDYLTENENQATTESNNFWQNVLNALQWALNTGVDIYDTYKGYTQQEWENNYKQEQLDWEKQQYADSQATSSQQLQAQYTAAAYDAAEQGQTQLANYYGNLAGLGENYFDNYTPTVTKATDYDSVANALTAAASMKAYGANSAAEAILQAAGLDSSLLNGYNPLALTTTTSSSGSKSSSSSTKSSSGSTLTAAQYLNYAKAYDSMADDNPAKATIGNMLAAYENGSSTSGASSTSSSQSGTANKLTNSLTRNSTSTDASVIVPYTAQRAKASGKSDTYIMQQLASEGYDNASIARIMNALG